MLVISDEVYKYMVYSGLGSDNGKHLDNGGAAAAASAAPVSQSVNGNLASTGKDKRLTAGVRPLPALRHIHFATLEGMWDRTITISSAGKTFSVTGWQVSVERGNFPCFLCIFSPHNAYWSVGSETLVMVVAMF